MSKTQENVESVHFNDAELKQILESLNDESNEGLSTEEIDRVAQAWAKVEREKLFKQ